MPVSERDAQVSEGLAALDQHAMAYVTQADDAQGRLECFRECKVVPLL